MEEVAAWDGNKVPDEPGKRALCEEGQKKNGGKKRYKMEKYNQLCLFCKGDNGLHLLLERAWSA